MAGVRYTAFGKKRAGGRLVWGTIRLDGRKQSFRPVGEGEAAQRILLIQERPWPCRPSSSSPQPIWRPFCARAAKRCCEWLAGVRCRATGSKRRRRGRLTALR